MSEQEKWRSPSENDEIGRPYGDMFFKRATGALPEMESKAAAKRLEPLILSADRLLDVGCGAAITP